MAERNTVPNLETKATDGNPVFTPRQWLERFRQFCKREHKIDITPLLKGENITDANWNGNEQAEFNLKYGQLFANQSESSKTKVETENGTSEEQNEIIDNQSHSNRTFEKDYGVNKIQQNENNTSGQYNISTQSSSCLPKETLTFVQNKIKPNLHTEFTEMDRDNFHHWGATREIMEIIRRGNNSPETSRLVEQTSTLSRPGTLRRRYDHQTQRTVFVRTRPNKRSR